MQSCWNSCKRFHKSRIRVFERLKIYLDTNPVGFYTTFAITDHKFYKLPSYLSFRHSVVRTMSDEERSSFPLVTSLTCDVNVVVFVFENMRSAERDGRITFRALVSWLV